MVGDGIGWDNVTGKNHDSGPKFRFSCYGRQLIGGFYQWKPISGYQNPSKDTIVTY